LSTVDSNDSTVLVKRRPLVTTGICVICGQQTVQCETGSPDNIAPLF
jgi:hypothetical protein